MKRSMPLVFAAVAGLWAVQAAAQVTFYQGDGFRGRAVTIDRPVPNLERLGFNDRASSAVVDRGRWEVCDDAGFRGRCVILRRGSYPDLGALGMNNNISSVRPANDRVRYEEIAPAPVAPVYEYRRRPNERVFEVPVNYAHAVVGPPERRCWVERQDVQAPPSGQPNVGGAIVGGIIGGVLGHQVGGGRGRDVATAGGAIAGAAIGSNVGREPGGVYSRDVERCADRVSGGPPEYWDVAYTFRGVEHHVQMSAPPGPTIVVNESGEPRQ